MTGYFGGYSRFSDEFQAQETEVALGMARAAARAGGRSSSSRCIRARPRSSRCGRPGCPSTARSRLRPGHSGGSRTRRSSPRGGPELPPPVDGPRPDGASHGTPGLCGHRASVRPASGGLRRGARGRGRARLSGGRQGARALAQVGRGRRRPRHRGRAGSRRGVGKMATLSAEGYSVERMAPVGKVSELIVGCLRDARFGRRPRRLGGVYAELLDDTAVALALDAAQAEELIALVAARRSWPVRGDDRRGLGGGRGGRRALAPRGVPAPSGRDRDQPLLVTPGSTCPRCPRSERGEWRRCSLREPSKEGRARHRRGQRPRARFRARVRAPRGRGRRRGPAPGAFGRDRRPDRGQGGKALAHSTDVRDPDQVDALVAAAVDRFGRSRCPREQRGEQRRQGGGVVPERLARGRRDRPRRRLPLLARGRVGR